MNLVQRVENLWKPDPKELVRKWQTQLRTETRQLERQIRDIQFEEKKVKKSIQDAAKRGDMGSAKALAKEIIQSRKAVGRLYMNKAQLMSLSTSLTEQLAMIRVAGTLSKSTEVMKIVNDMVKLPQLQKTMAEMSREMMRAGLIEEMMGDALDMALDDEEMEEETEEEISKVLEEIAVNTASKLPAARPRPAKVQEAPAAEPEEQEEEGDLDDLQARLNAVVVFPEANRRDWEELTEDLRAGLEPHFVEQYAQIFELALEHDTPLQPLPAPPTDGDGEGGSGAPAKGEGKGEGGGERRKPRKQ